MALGARSDKADHGSRRELIVREVLAGLFDRRFAPGERLRVEHLGARFGTSATPVREALVELAGIGVVELKPNCGAVLRPFGPRQLREIFQVRRILECEAVRCACERIAPFELESLARELKELARSRRGPKWSADTRRLDTQLHELIAERCGSERLRYEIGRYATLYRTLRDARHRRRTARANYTQMDENSEHLAIVTALVHGNARQAAEAMSCHIMQALAALEQDLFNEEEIAADRVEPFLGGPVVSIRNGRRPPAGRRKRA